mmetsp:Transcript_3953/g.6211  ORF Transcript_3953/g.6211 Transcript_3953/m.6211 type:complete len:341 (+) Transcript_3953:403-1425(+)
MPRTPRPNDAVVSSTKPVNFQAMVLSNASAGMACTVVYGRAAPRMSPGCHLGDLDTSTRAVTKPDTGPATAPAPDLIRERWYGSALTHSTSSRRPPSVTSPTGASVILKCSGPGIPSSRGAINSRVLAGTASAAATAASNNSGSTCGFLPALPFPAPLPLPAPLPDPSAAVLPSASRHTAARCPTLPQTLHSLSLSLQSAFTWLVFPQTVHGLVGLAPASGLLPASPESLHTAERCPTLPQVPHSLSLLLQSAFTWFVLPHTVHGLVDLVLVSVVPLALQTAARCPTLPQTLHSLSLNLHSAFKWLVLPHTLHALVSFFPGASLAPSPAASHFFCPAFAP